jgi:hypothetical protein
VGRDDRVGVGGVDAVEAEQGVEVDGATALHLGGLAVRQPHRRSQPHLPACRAHGDGWDTAVSAEFGQVAFGGLFGAVPQFGGVQVKHDVVVMVVAVQAQRLAQHRVTDVMPGPADRRSPMVTEAGVAAGVAGLGSAVAVPPIPAGVPGDVAAVHGPEAGGGEGEEHRRMLRDRSRDAFAADEPGA